MSASNAAIRGLLVSITGGQLLVPSAIVAEIIHCREVEAPMTEPPWMMGVFTWRQQKVPLLSLEKFFGVQRQVTPETPHIIVLYGLHEVSTLPFYAFISQAVPHILVVKPTTLSAFKAANRPGLVASVSINEQQTGWLPDLLYIEKQVYQALA